MVLALASVVYGATASDPVTVSCTVDDYISLSNPGNVTLANIAGAGGDSESNATWTVSTNNSAGYKLEVSDSGGGSDALMKGTDLFTDLVDGGSPIAWAVAANESEFGFSAEGNATPGASWGDPGSGTGNYRGFQGATGIEVANNTSATASEDTTVYFRAGVGASKLQPSGTYSASLTVTATTL